MESVVIAVLNQPTRHALNQSGLFTRSDGITERVYFGQTAEPWNEHEWEIAVKTLQEAHHTSRQGEAEFVVVYIPRKFRVYKDHLRLVSGTAIAQWEINGLPEALGSWCADNGIHFLDTTPHLANHVEAGEHPYFVDDVHWNRLGRETAARLVAEYLASENIFP